MLDLIREEYSLEKNETGFSLFFYETDGEREWIGEVEINRSGDLLSLSNFPLYELIVPPLGISDPWDDVPSVFKTREMSYQLPVIHQS